MKLCKFGASRCNNCGYCRMKWIKSEGVMEKFETKVKGKVVEMRQKITTKKYFLVVSNEDCVMEVWADKAEDLKFIVNIYDDKEQPHPVSMIIDVAAEEIYKIKRVSE